MKKHNKKAVVIDGNAIMYKAYYGAAYKKDSSDREISDNTCTIIYKTIENLLVRGQYSYGVVVFDSGKKTFRTQKLPEYKANRPPMPATLINTIERILAMVKRLNLAILIAPKMFEGDDVIGTLADEFTKLEIICDIYTTDKDLLQLVSHSVSVNLIKKGLNTFIEYTHKNFLKLNDGLLPYQIPFLKSLAGDDSDNYKGLPGLGEKKAAVIVKKFKNIENLLGSIEGMPPKLKGLIEEHKDQLVVFYEIATIVRDAPVFINLKSFDIAELIKANQKRYQQ